MTLRRPWPALLPLILIAAGLLAGCGPKSPSQRTLLIQDLDKLYFDYHYVPLWLDPVIRDVARGDTGETLSQDIDQAYRELVITAADLKNGQHAKSGPFGKLESAAVSAAAALRDDTVTLGHQYRVSRTLTAAQLQTVIGSDRARWNAAINALWNVRAPSGTDPQVICALGDTACKAPNS